MERKLLQRLRDLCCLNLRAFVRMQENVCGNCESICHWNTHIVECCDGFLTKVVYSVELLKTQFEFHISKQ